MRICLCAEYQIDCGVVIMISRKSFPFLLALAVSLLPGCRNAARDAHRISDGRQSTRRSANLQCR